jgi:DNA-binding NarL/FixJ family response regulator
MSRKIKVGIVEDHDMVRQGIVRMLEEVEYIELMFDSPDGADALEQLKNSKLDILLLDLNLPKVSGRQVMDVVKDRYLNLSVIVISGNEDKLEVMECIRLGAKAFLPKHSDFEKVLNAIRHVFENGFYIDDLVSQALIFEAKYGVTSNEDETETALSQREVEIMERVCVGKTNNEIADELFISKRTVDGHRLNISKKTGAYNIAELVIYSIKKGIYKI